MSSLRNIGALAIWPLTAMKGSWLRLFVRRKEKPVILTESFEEALGRMNLSRADLHEAANRLQRRAYNRLIPAVLMLGFSVVTLVRGPTLLTTLAELILAVVFLAGFSAKALRLAQLRERRMMPYQEFIRTPAYWWPRLPKEGGSM